MIHKKLKYKYNNNNNKLKYKYNSNKFKKKNNNKKQRFFSCYNKLFKIKKKKKFIKKLKFKILNFNFKKIHINYINNYVCNKMDVYSNIQYFLINTSNDTIKNKIQNYSNKFHNYIIYYYLYYKFTYFKLKKYIIINKFKQNMLFKINYIKKKKKIKLSLYLFWNILFRNKFFNVLTNSLMYSGKKEKSENIIYNLLILIKNKIKRQPFYFVLFILKSLQPIVKIYSITRFGKKFDLPKVIKPKKRVLLLLKIFKLILLRTKNKKKKKKHISFDYKFASELMLASVKKGTVFKKIIESYRDAYLSRTNLYFLKKKYIYKKKKHLFK